MTTPRVTVPVAPKGVSPVYTAAYDSIRKGAPGLSGATCAVIARSINMKVSHLSASPAPEGGAVADALQRLRVLRDQARNGTAVSDTDEYDAGELDAILSVIEPALATREEAPDWTARTEAAWAENNREEALAGAKALAFFKWARDFFWREEGCEIDGGDFQDAAERFGLIVQVPFDPERHADNGYGLEAGDDWYETEPAVDQALAALQAEQKGGA